MRTNHPRAGHITACLAAITIVLACTLPATALPTASVGDLRIVDPSPIRTATAAAGAFSGNDKPANALHQLNTLDVFGLGATWGFVGSSDQSGAGPFTSNPGGATGSLIFDSVIDDPFVVALKSASSYSLYYFADGPARELSFDTSGTATTPQGSPQSLSHASLYLTTSTPTVPPTGPPPDPEDPEPQGQLDQASPEPAAGLLTLAGLAAIVLGGSRRRST